MILQELFQQIVDVPQDNPIDEAGAGPARIARHIRNGDVFMMLSGMRADLDPVENKRRTARLRSTLNALPVSYVQTTGDYHEDGQDEPSTEQSFFIMPRSQAGELPVAEFFGMGRAIMADYDQDAILCGDGKKVGLIYNDGKTSVIGDCATFDPAEIAKLDGFSRIGGRAFSFTKQADLNGRGVAYGGNCH